MFLHKEERKLKAKKWKLWALWKKLVCFDGHTIYKVYIKKQGKVIIIKDFQIFEDNMPKKATNPLTYKESPTLQSFLIKVNDNNDKALQPAALLLIPASIDSELRLLFCLVQLLKTQASRTVRLTKKSK